MKNKMLLYLYILLLVAVALVTAYSTSIKKSILVFNNATAIENEKKEVYLTFDDAPGDRVTEEILDVLKEYNVKGTFFIVGNRIDGREKILLRICEEGNSVGLHSYSHNMKKIYPCSKCFIDEMQITSNKICDLTGIRSYIIRFPGGSKPFMTKDFLEELHVCKFIIFDWNLAVSDGINAKCSPEKFYKEATTTRGFKSPLIILMHCSGENENTVKALPKIIEHYREIGYEFKVLNNDSPEYHFRVKDKQASQYGK